MEMTLQPQMPLCCRIRPTLGPFSQHKQVTRIRITPLMAASSGSDYSRRRLRKSSIPKTKITTPKGFAPRPHIGTGTQKKDQIDSEGKEGPGTSDPSDYTLSSSEFSETKIVGEAHKSGFGSQSGISNDAVKRRTDMPDEVGEQGYGIEDRIDEKDFLKEPSPSLDDYEMHEQRAEAEGDGIGLRKQRVVVVYNDEEIEEGIYNDEEIEEGIVADIGESLTDLEYVTGLEAISRQAQRYEVDSRSNLLNSPVKVKKDMLEEVEREKVSIENKMVRTSVQGKHSTIAGSKKVEKETVVKNDGDTSKELDKVDEHVVTKEPDMEESMAKQKADMDAQARRQMLEDLAEENHSRGNKIFVFPEEVKPDQVIEVFLNRSLTALMNENDVSIKGAFNGWRWKSFTEKMHKTDHKGDWWSCPLYIPKEAYKIDFVFFNGGNAYENNNHRDFYVLIDGGMDESYFEDFLLEEKWKELKRLAAEKAERERQAEEQRRREAENAACEADRAQAKTEVDKKREAFRQVMKLAKSVGDVWHIKPSVFKGGDRVKLYYNRSSRPLAHAAEVWVHGDHNNWNEGLTIVERLLPSEQKDGDWWYANVVIPDRALVVDWVFADGPPQKAKVYDNNNFQDFHATVATCVSEELFWVEEEPRIYRKLQEERKHKEEALHRMAEKTARLKAETKERTMKKHIVYTEPLDVRAGCTATVFYNPSHTVLNGKPDVWFRCSFNHWTHRNDPLPPQKMVRAVNGSHLKAIVKVPFDAYIMDFVFSEKEDGGIYDNKNGQDYHIPVAGGILKEPPMHIVHIAVEMAPIAKVGGLGDVVTSLSRAVQDLGHSVDIILPKYDCMNHSNVRDFHFHRSFAWGGTEIKVWFGKVEGLSTYFLEPHNGMFSVGCIYGRNDGDRFGFFCHAALEFLLQCGSHPDILHCHDWSSAPVAWLFKEHYMHHGLCSARVIFTIHNLEFGLHNIGKAMTYADKATTVSHTYSKEVSGNPAISPHLYKFHGIINGIDQDIWDPYNDNFIPVCYTSENVVEGKKAAKEALQQRLGLRRSDHPLVGIITRLTVQKGIHLIKHAIERTLERNGQVVLLGSAPDPRIQNDFVDFANQLHSSHGGSVRLCLTYDEPLSHLIYAGSDFILVPSIFEPCGLTQLTAMRYGSIPVVRKTGGLCDTVFDVDNDKERAQAQGLEPNGFSFEGADSGSVDYALNRAIAAWYNGREWFNSLCKCVMEQDWSWKRPALDYIELYRAARKT